MSSPAPSYTPERAPPTVYTPNGRRSFTLPARIANKPRPSPASTNSSDGIETLFVCSSTKIVSFTASPPARRISPTRRQNGNDDSRAIPWTSPTERTMAVGVLRIYRVTSSNVSFLNSSSLLHTIFPKSQCWRVDGESIFVLRVRQDSYYRIELPLENSEDKEKVEQFKIVLSQVLQFEKTQSPFSRVLVVQVSERPKTPPRRQLKKPTGQAKKWLFDKKWVPENGSRPSTPVLEGSDCGTTSSYEEDDRSSINTDGSSPVPESPETPLEVTPPKAPSSLSVTERANSFQGSRSITAPTAFNRRRSGLKDTVQHDEQSEPILKDEARTKLTEESEMPVERKDSADRQSILSSTDSYYSLDTSTQRSPSPPYIDAEGDLINPWAETLVRKEQDIRGRSTHRRQVSELTLRASSEDQDKDAPVTPMVKDHASSIPTLDVFASSPPATPPLVSDSDDDSVGRPSLDVPTPPDTIRMKRLTGASQRRAYSPMPQPQNLFCPPAYGPRKQFTAALIRKTCELVLGPPAHLVQLMLRIAAKVSDGVFSFNTYRVRQTTEKIPGSWDSSDDEWPEEDDFGIPLRTLDESTSRDTSRRRNFSGESID